MSSVLICGFYGNGNLGDEAMLAGMMTMLRGVDTLREFTVLSADPAETACRHRVRSVQRMAHDGRIDTTEISHHDVFVLGGGDLLRDSVDYPVASAWLTALAHAQRSGLRTVVLGVSVGEIWKPETRALVPEVLSRVDLLAVRDTASKAALKDLGVHHQVHVMGDLALEALPDIRPCADVSALGLSLRQLVGRGRGVDTQSYDPFLRRLAGVTDELVAREGAVVHLLPFRSQPSDVRSYDDDRVAAEAFLQYSTAPDAYVSHNHMASPQMFCEIAASCKIVIGMRLHALVLAAGMGTPVLALEYDVKVKNFMAEISRPDDSIPLAQVGSQIAPRLARMMAQADEERVRTSAAIATYRDRTRVVVDSLRRLVR